MPEQTSAPAYSPVVIATVAQPVPETLQSWFGHRVLAVLIGVDILVNALCGGRMYQTISSRIGESIRAGGWASRAPWPGWWRRHCEASVYTTLV